MKSRDLALISVAGVLGAAAYATAVRLFLRRRRHLRPAAGAELAINGARKHPSKSPFDPSKREGSALCFKNTLEMRLAFISNIFGV